MRYVCIVRHGEYNKRTSHLLPRGRLAVRQLGEELRRIFAGQAIALFSSSAGRAQETAAIIQSALGVSVTTHRFLRSTTDLTNSQVKKAINLVAHLEKQVDVIILVTHFEFTRDLPRHIGERFLRKTFLKKPVERGRAWLMDWRTRRMRQVP